MEKASSVLELMKDSPLVALRGRASSSPRARLWAELEAEEASGRICFIIASGPSRAQALCDIEEAARRAHVEVAECG
jgi:hypothetical protein